MSRNLLVAVTLFFALGLAAAWNGRRVRESLAQVEAQVAGANRQRMEIGKLNAGAMSADGRPRAEDSVLVLAEHVAPWLISSTPGLAGAAVGQSAMRNTIWRPTTWGAERGLEVFENAQTMAAGHFDLALVMVVLLPLVILYAPRQETILLTLGPAVSLVAIALSGAPLGSLDTWLRTAMWLLLTGLYGFLWLAVRRREPSYWLKALIYVAMVILVPALAPLIGSLAVPPPSRVLLAQQTQSALRPVMEKTSRELSPFYEAHPEFAEGGHTAAQYDQVRLRVEAERRAAVTPWLNAAESRAAGHQRVVEILAKLSPASILYLALLETAGTGTSRQEAFEESAREFGQKWSADIKVRMGKGHPIRPAELDQMPRYTYVEQSPGSWLFPAAVGLLGLLAWFGVLRALKDRALPTV